MTSFVIDETHLRRLSPSARHELLRLIATDVSELRAEFVTREWSADRDISYPLSAEEARVLIRGVTEAGRNVLKVIARNFDGERGHGEVGALLEATGCQTYQQLGTEIAGVTHSVRSITGNHDAWIFNFRAEDWIWDEATSTYTKGRYFISGAAIRSLRLAFGYEKASDAVEAAGS